jgi:hypothetical protein
MAQEFTWENAKKHAKLILKHKWLVMKGCFQVGLFWQGITHDLSKFSPTEFIVGVRYFQGNRSPNAAEREKMGYSTAWLHHKGRNKHHYEYWCDVSPDKKGYAPIEMPPRYLAEMVMDRIAASKTYKGKDYTDATSLEYLELGVDEKGMHPQTYKDLVHILTMLKNHGERYTFRYIRRKVLGKKF